MSEPRPRRKHKMRVNLEEVKAMLKFYERLVKPDLRDLAFFQDGKAVPVPEEVIERWRFIGLHNIDFMRDHFFKSKHVRIVTLTKKVARKVAKKKYCGQQFWASTLDPNVPNICTQEKGHLSPCSAQKERGR